MSNLVPQNDPLLAEFMAMSDEDHLNAVGTLRGEIGERLLRLGKGVYSWKLKGKSMDDLGMNGMTPWLLMVGGDELYAPLLAKTMRNKELTKKLSRLCLADQRHAGDGGTVDLLLRGGETLQVRLVDVKDDAVLNQLIGKDSSGRSYIRSLADQRHWLEKEKAKAAKPVPERIGNLAPDQTREGCIYLGKRGDFISADTLLAAYRACKRKESA